VIDRREQILARLRALMTLIPGLVKVARNADEASGQARPALILHDGVTERIDNGEGGSVNSQAQMMRLSPSIALLMGKPTEEIGPALSEFLRLILLAVLNDAELKSILNAGDRNQVMRFESLAVTTEAGETREGRMEMVFTFDYPFILSELI
jgi:hypothetical protein